MMGVKGEKWIVGMPINVLVSNEIGKGNDKQMRKRGSQGREKVSIFSSWKKYIFKGLLRYTNRVMNYAMMKEKKKKQLLCIYTCKIILIIKFFKCHNIEMNSFPVD